MYHWSSNLRFVSMLFLNIISFFILPKFLLYTELYIESLFLANWTIFFLWVFFLVIAYLIWINCKSHCYQNNQLTHLFLFTFRNHHFSTLYNTFQLSVAMQILEPSIRDTKRMIHFFFNLFGNTWCCSLITHSIKCMDYSFSVRITISYYHILKYSTDITHKTMYFLFVTQIGTFTYNQIKNKPWPFVI